MSAMVERVELEAAFLLHAQPYRESSKICEIFTQQHGRVGVVANGARRPKSRWRSVLRSFQPLRISWSGRGSLYTLRLAEPSAPAFGIGGAALMSAWYMNELLILLMHRRDPHPALFAHYAAALDQLAADARPDAALRRFEIELLAEVGYGLVLDRDVVDHQPLEAGRYYEYIVDRGPVPVADDRSGTGVFKGAELLAIGHGALGSDASLRCARRLLRPALDRALGGRRLRTREVMASMVRS